MMADAYEHITDAELAMILRLRAGTDVEVDLGEEGHWQAWMSAGGPVVVLGEGADIHAGEETS